ncbi:hypothetical protein DPX16_3521 [Anabarilius grahami]|uniref:Uncharacterized protein n=1 Tax=Anabarilius grahami TaxID=495550 RepID=A0A3N0Y6S9_ANAGA|nr:hypothetical protein DPX16_3521 [Anabarilius grahami]
MQELKRLMAMKLGPLNWYRVKGLLHREGCRREHHEWDHRDNADYREAVLELANVVKAAFPVRVEATKLNDCLQEKGESVRAHYYRLYELFNRHSGMPEPNVRGADPSLLECHLSSWFTRGLRDDIMRGMKAGLVGWKDTRLADLLTYAMHVEEQLEEAKEAEAKRAAEAEKQIFTKDRLAAAKREKARAKSDIELQLALFTNDSCLGSCPTDC